MTRNEAAAAVNEAFKAAKVLEAIKDPKATGFSVEVAGHCASYTFKHKARHEHALEGRREEVAKLRLALVDELIAKAPGFLSPKAAEAEVAEAEIVEEPEEPSAS